MINANDLNEAIGEMENVNDPARGIARGIALDPGTPLALVEPLLRANARGLFRIDQIFAGDGRRSGWQDGCDQLP